METRNDMLQNYHNLTWYLSARFPEVIQELYYEPNLFLYSKPFYIYIIVDTLFILMI